MSAEIDLGNVVRVLSAEADGAIGGAFLRGEAHVELDSFVGQFDRPVPIEPCARMIAEAVKRFDAGKRPDSDAWLAPRLHASLRLTPREAADTRVWNYLTVLKFPDYVQWRWNGEDGVTRDRYLGNTTKNALARLWWGAELTRNGPDYSGTVKAFSAQDIPNTWFRLDLYHHRPLALGAIRVMMDLRGGGGVKATSKVNRMATAVNMALTATSLDVLLPFAGTDVDALGTWIASEFDEAEFLEALPVGPPEEPVSEDALDSATELVTKIATEAGLFEDQSGEPLFE